MAQPRIEDNLTSSEGDADADAMKGSSSGQLLFASPAISIPATAATTATVEILTDLSGSVWRVARRTVLNSALEASGKVM